MLAISSLSTEYVRVQIQATNNGSPEDPTADSVSMALVTEGAVPAAGDWKTASWETDATQSPTAYYARCLVGSGGAVTLAAGVYDVWVKVSDNPEVPVKKSGPIRVI